MAEEGTEQGVKRKLSDPSLPNVLAKKLSPPRADAHYCKGQEVYVRTADYTWVRAVVTNVSSQKTLCARIDGTDKIVSCGVRDVLLRSDKPLDDCLNLTQVTPIHEATVLYCLHERFLTGQYYTYAGTTVVAVNPFHDVSHLYTMQQIQAYHSKAKDLPPHIYPVAEAAYTSLVRELGKVNQSIVVSGESGAGKTVSAKHLLKYLTIVSNPEKFGDQVPADVHTGGKIEQRILDSNPILEAFGNAATPRNDNSSRFGKFIELQFMRMGHIQGGAIQTYLLEKTRVVHQGHGENNFHVFYQMAGMSSPKLYPDWLQPVQMEMNETFFSCVPLNQECQENDDIHETLDAMTDIGLSQEKQQAVFETLLAVLYLGNLRFIQVSDEESSDLDCSVDASNTSQMSENSYVEVSVTERALERSCQLLGLSPVQLRQTLLHRCIQPGGRNRQSVFVKPIGITEAQSRRDCLAMLLYSRLFEWLVGFINRQIRSEFFENTIGLLDIYGFETFEVNSLEQLCINYANERLQQHYVAHFLHQLQVEYTEESITWVPVDYSDNRPCVDILDGRASIFSVLNEEVYLNRKSNDSALIARILDLRSGSQDHLRPKRPSLSSAPSFVVQHYAGAVTYCVSGLVKKNRDDIPADLIALLSGSDNPFVGELFQSFHCAESPGKKKKTVLTKFKSSLDELMSSLVTSDIHYIRCLKPNEQNAHGLFQPPYVLQQLRACGAIETVDICRRGYPARMPYNEFQQRYSLILRRHQYLQDRLSPQLPSDDELYRDKENICDSLDELLQQQLDLPRTPKKTPTPRKRLRRRTGLTQHDHSRKVCASVLQIVFGGRGGKSMCQQFGRTKLFLLENQLEELERMRAEVLNASSLSIQTAWRAFLCRRHFRRYMAASRICRAWRTYCSRVAYLRLRQATLVLQKYAKEWLHRRREKEEKERQRLLREEEERLRLLKEEEERLRLLKEEEERRRLLKEEKERLRLLREEKERERQFALEEERRKLLEQKEAEQRKLLEQVRRKLLEEKEKGRKLLEEKQRQLMHEEGKLKLVRHGTSQGQDQPDTAATASQLWPHRQSGLDLSAESVPAKVMASAPHPVPSATIGSLHTKVTARVDRVGAGESEYMVFPNNKPVGISTATQLGTRESKSSLPLGRGDAFRVEKLVADCKLSFSKPTTTETASTQTDMAATNPPTTGTIITSKTIPSTPSSRRDSLCDENSSPLSKSTKTIATQTILTGVQPDAAEIYIIPSRRGSLQDPNSPLGRAGGDLDLSGNLSDDSGVMVHEPLHLTRARGRPPRGVGIKGTEALGPPEKKRQKLADVVKEYPKLSNLQVGEGVITRRRIPKYGSRFHTKMTVLKYSHLTNRRDLPSGLPDALPEADDTSVD